MIVFERMGSIALPAGAGQLRSREGSGWVKFDLVPIASRRLLVVQCDLSIRDSHVITFDLINSLRAGIHDMFAMFRNLPVPATATAGSPANYGGIRLVRLLSA
jgi:hypothetical protein